MARRQPDPRRPGVAAIGLGAGLVVVGLAIVYVLAGGGGPAPTATPFGALTPSPTTTGSGSPATAPASPRASSSAVASASADASAVTSPPAAAPTATRPSPGATVTPSPGAAGPRRTLLFDRMGIDNISAPEAMARLITFEADGPADITLTLVQLSVAHVTMCLWQGEPGGTPPADECRVVNDGTMTRGAPAGRTTWTASIVGAQPGRSPWAQLRLRFPAHQPTVRLAQFRFQGLPNPDYNGLTAQVTAGAAGDLRLGVTWDDEFGGSYPYRLRVDDVSAPLSDPFFDEGTSDSFDVLVPVEAEHDYLIFFENRSDDFNERVIYEAALSWP